MIATQTRTQHHTRPHPSYKKRHRPAATDQAICIVAEIRRGGPTLFVPSHDGERTLWAATGWRPPLHIASTAYCITSHTLQAARPHLTDTVAQAAAAILAAHRDEDAELEERHTWTLLRSAPYILLASGVQVADLIYATPPSSSVAPHLLQAIDQYTGAYTTEEDLDVIASYRSLVDLSSI